MSQTIKLKRTAVAGRIPALNVLELGEVAINTADGKMYIKKSVNGVESIVEIGGSGEGFTAFTTYTYTATANQTVFSGADANNNSLDIVDEFSNVFLNGILLDPDTDFTIAPGGFSVTLSVAAEAGDLLQVNTYDQAIFNGTLSVNALELDGSAGLITWNGTEETVDIPLNSDVTLQVGQEQVFRGKATEAISNGDVVMFAGAQGDHLLVAKADINSLGFRPEFVIGLATQDFAINDFGFVTSQGKVRGLDTANGWSEGDVIYLDPTTAGAWTTTVPTPPSHIIQVAAVTRSHGTEGTVLVRVTHFSDTDEVPEGSTNLYFTDARATAAIKADADWNASDWDTAYGWGDHSTENYLTTVDFNDLTSKPTTIAGYGITDAFDGAYGSLTGAPTNVSSFTNDSGYITDYSVTQGDVTAHQGALSITESQISDFGTYLTSETTTSLSASGNILTYTDEDGNSNTIDLSLYIDDTNAARITSGTMSGSGIATFTRDDSTTFTVDMSVLLDDTNLARITSAAWNTSNGVLTLTRNDASTITVDLDDRYLTSHQDISGKANLSGDTFTGPVTFTEQGSTFKIDPHAVGVDLYSSGNLAPHYQTTFTLYTGNIGTGSQRLNLDASGNLSVTGTLSASGYNKSNWDTAYGWGNHASAGYLTSLPSHNHNDLYYTETESDSRFVNVTGDTMTGSLNLSSNKLILIDGNHYLQYASTSHSGHTVDGPRLEGHQGGELSTNYTGIETALRWTHTNNVHLYGELKMGETTVIDGSKNLTNIGTISLAGSSNRPMFIGQAGSITTKGSSGGWSQGLLYYGSSNTYRGGFGALGTGDALDYFWIGSEYNDGSNFRFYPNGTFNIGGTTVIDSSRNATFASQLIVRGAGNSSKGNIHMGNAGNGTNKWSYLTGAHYNADTESEGFALIGGFSSSLDNRVVIGGSIYESNPCTSIEFWGHTATTHATGGSLRGAIDHDGFNVLTGGYRVNSTTVIDSSRNFSGNHGTFAGDVIVNNSNGYNYLRINKGTGGDGGVLFEVADSLKWQNVQRDDGGLQWYSYGRGGTNVIFPSLGGIELHAGDYKIGTTTVIDSSRNILANGVYLGYWNNSTTNSVGRIGQVSDRPTGTITNQIGGSANSYWEVVDYGWTKVLAQVYNNGLFRAYSNIDTQTGGYQVNGTTVIDSARNASFSSLAVNGVKPSATAAHIESTSQYVLQLEHNINSTAGDYYDTISLLNDTNAVNNYTQMGFRTRDADGQHHRATILAHRDGGTSFGGVLKLRTRPDSGSPTDTLTLFSNGDVDVRRGNLNIVGTTVIDSSRNLTNIGNINLVGKVEVTGGEGREIRTYMPSSYTTNDIVSGHEYGWYDAYWRIGMSRSGDTAGEAFRFNFNGSYVAQVGTTGIFDGEGYRVNGTAVIDASRNLTNIGTIGSTATNNILKVMSTGDSQVIGLKASYLDHPTLAGYFRYSTGDAQLYIDNAFASNGGEAYSNINFRNGSSLVTRMQIKGNTGRVNVVNGLELNGTTVIDSNRSLTSIASLDITSATGNITFSNSGLTKRGIYGTMGDNDQWFIGGGATSSNVGYLEISTGDDGQNTSGGCEEILVRQYGPGDPLTGALHRTLKLLDNYGNTSIPANVTMANGNLDINTSVQNAIEIFESSGSSGYNYMRFLNTTGSTQYGSIYRSFSSMVYGTSSDYRLKENVVDLTNASDRINLIPVRRFNFIEHPDRTVDGFLAHEVQAVVPEAIIGEKDGVDDTGAPVYQGIDQSKLVPLLTAALQEALQEIENLKQETQSLIDRVTNLENN